MENQSQVEITSTQIYVIISIVILFLVGYFGYKLLLNDNSQVSLNKQVNDLSDVNLIKNNTISNESVTENVCDSLEGDLKKNCKLKTKVCENDECFYNQAVLTKNESNCFNIKDLNLRVTCTSSISYSKIIQGAVTSDDITVCEKLEVSEVIQGCRDNYNYVKAINTKDKSFCENIVNIAVKNECLK